MADYEASEMVDVGADDAFAYLSDVRNLPAYMTRMTRAERRGDDTVEVTAQLVTDEGREEVTAEAWLRVDADERRLEWGSEGPHGYHGELRVSPDGDGAQVAVRIVTTRTDGPGIRRDLARTAGNVKRLVEADHRPGV